MIEVLKKRKKNLFKNKSKKLFEVLVVFNVQITNKVNGASSYTTFMMKSKQTFDYNHRTENIKRAVYNEHNVDILRSE